MRVRKVCYRTEAKIQPGTRAHVGGGTSQERHSRPGDTVVSIAYSQLSLWDQGGHYLPKRQKTKQMVTNHSELCSFTMDIYIFF